MEIKKNILKTVSALNNKKPVFWIIAVVVVACVAAAVWFFICPNLSFSDKRLIQQSYSSAYACVFENHVEIEKENAEVIRNGEAIEVVFPATNGEQQIRVTNIIKNGKIHSQSTVIEDRINLLTFSSTAVLLAKAREEIPISDSENTEIIIAGVSENEGTAL